MGVYATCGSCHLAQVAWFTLAPHLLQRYSLILVCYIQARCSLFCPKNHLYKIKKLLLGLERALILPRVQIGSRLPGKVPLSGTFPGNPIVLGLLPVVPPNMLGPERRERPWARNWYRTAVFLKCAHAPNVVAQWSNTQPKPLSRDCPRKVGAFRIQCGRSVVKKIRPLQTVPSKHGTKSERGVRQMKQTEYYRKMSLTLMIFAMFGWTSWTKNNMVVITERNKHLSNSRSKVKG